MKVKKAVIPAAGLGTRFLPITKSVAKEILPIVDKPTIQIIIEEIVASGIEEVLIITGRNKEMILNHFDRSPELEELLKKNNKEAELKEIQAISEMAKIFSVRQREAKGLGHAILCAKEFVGDEPFAVILGDDLVYNEGKPALKQLLEVYEKTQTSVIGVQQVAPEQVDKYGIIAGSEISPGLYKIEDLVEKPAIGQAPSNIAILGRYVINPRIFEILEGTKKGRGGEIQLTDGLKTLLAEEAMVACAFEGKRYDVGDKLGFLQASVEYGLRNETCGQAFKAYLKELSDRL